MPTAVESHFNIGAVLFTLPNASAAPATSQSGIGGRSSISNGLLLPAVLQQHAADGLLQPSLGALTAALQKLLGSSHHQVEVIGIGTNSSVLGALIALLRNHGFSVKAGLCDGSVRPGFSGPTALFRVAVGTPANLFIRQVGLARTGAT